jgi:hypothetical protein
MIRRAHARRAGETLPVETTVLAPDVATVPVARPEPPQAAVDLQPQLEIHDAIAEAAAVVVEPDIWSGVDVVPLRLVASLVAVRAPTMRIRTPAERTLDALTVDAIARDVVLTAPTARAARPAPIELCHRRATPAATVDQTWLREALLRLYRASRLTSPGDLELVGIYERVPGGAIASIALDDEGIVLRVHPNLRARPATLLVGRPRGSSELFPVEVDSPANRRS